MENPSLIFLGLLATLPLLTLTGVLGAAAYNRARPSAFVLGAGLVLLFVGERLLGESASRMWASGAGLLVVAASLALAARAQSATARRSALAHVVVVLGLCLYGLALPTVTDALAFGEDALARWLAVIAVTWPILVLVGLSAMVSLAVAEHRHPVAMPAGAGQNAWETGLAVALSIALVFPVNYLADAHNISKDVAYFRTTRPGSATVSMLATGTDPVEAVLFFPSGNDVGREVKAYFDDLAQQAGDRLTVRLVDQALDPATAEKLKVRDNGDIAFVSGEKDQRFKIGLELNKARKDLKRLDSLVQTNLLKLTRAQRTAYFLAGHGEASSREKDNPLEKLNLFKKVVLESQNFKVANLGVSEGSAVAVPDDAAVVVIAAPKKPLLPEEISALKAYWDKGGRLLVMVEPGAERLPDLLGHLGVVAGEHPLAHAEKYVQQTRGPADRVLLVTNKYGSHESVKTLSKNSTQLYVVLPTAVSIAKADATTNKVTTMLRSFPDTWEDADGDRAQGDTEKGKVFEFGQAVSMGDEKTGSRAVVLGDVNAFADPVLESLQGNQQLALDATRWLVGEDDVAGTTESEEDVKVQHTREEDVYWFWFTTAAVPGLILAVGALMMRIRGRRA